MKLIVSLILGAAAALLLQSGVAAAAEDAPPPPLDVLVAPIALYPDTLLANILVAALHPAQVVEANRWLHRPENAGRQVGEADDALATQPWDSSIKALVVFPSVVAMMDNDLRWTEALGDAYSREPDAIMNAIQNLRRQALNAGTLATTPQQKLNISADSIGIEPSIPDTVYVPRYDPRVAYGAWSPTDYSPMDFAGPAFADFGPVPVFLEYVIVGRRWRHGHMDWHHHRIHFPGGSRTPSGSGATSAIAAPTTAIPAPRTAIPASRTAITARRSALPVAAPALMPAPHERPLLDNPREGGRSMRPHSEPLGSTYPARPVMPVISEHHSFEFGKTLRHLE